MKKVLLLSFSLLLIAQLSKATVHVVQVANYQFTPATIPNVIVGDVIRWVWVSGSHTTTCDPFGEPGTQLPSGAPTWDAPIKSSSPQFEYTVTVPGNYIYYCSPHAPNMAGTFTASLGTVPLKLTSFLVKNDNNQPSLVWKTQNEVNTDYFSVRRSADGKTYEEVVKINAQGNSSVENTYTYADKKIASSQKFYYYTVAAVDKDGKTTFSEVRMFKNGAAPVKLVLALSPNPVTREGHLNMSFNSDVEGKMSVRVVSPQGKTIVTRNMQAYPGVNNGHVHLGERPAGTYTVICSMNGISETHRIVVQ